MLIYYLQMIDTSEAQDKFTAAYTTYCDMMHSIAFEILESHHDAEDAVHNAFLVIMKNMDKFSSVKDLKTKAYFARITQTVSIDYLRKRDNHPTFELNEVITNIPVSEDSENAKLQKAIQRLPAQYQEVLMYYADAKLDTADIAKILGITRINAQKRIWRAKEALRREYEKEDDKN